MPKDSCKIKFIFLVPTPVYGKSAEGKISSSSPNTIVDIIQIQENGISLDLLLSWADAARQQNPIKYGTTPFLGRGSSQPSIYHVIETSVNQKKAISGPDEISAFHIIDASVSKSTSYFLVCNKRAETVSESDTASENTDDDDTDEAVATVAINRVLLSGSIRSWE